jgi:hypothetical protein
METSNSNLETFIETIKSLDQPGDIKDAVVDLSKKFGGKVMIKLSPKDEGKQPIWVSPLRLQFESEYPKESQETTRRFVEEWEAVDRRIDEIALLEITDVSRMPESLKIQAAAKKFAEKQGYKPDNHYVGKFTKIENR